MLIRDRYRSVEHNTEEQPWDPISAATAALVGDIGALGMAVADFPREVFKGATKGRKSRTNTATGDDGLLAPNPPSRRPSSSRSETGSTASLPKTSTQSTAEAPLVSQPSQSSNKTQARSAPSNTNEPPKSPSPSPVTLDLAVGAGKGVMRILGTSAKIHTNFCLGLARGFRNAPKLYNDETVRPANEKVTSFSTGLKLAGKEFGLGMYDGVAGLITQPLKGAEKEGGVGLVKGFGKGIGGLMLKPAAGFWALPAYTFAGVQAEVRNKIMGKGMGGGVGDYIVASRVKEGEIEEGKAELTEKGEVINKWNRLQGSKELKGFAGLKRKEEKEGVEGNKLKKGMPSSASVSSIEGGLDVGDPMIEAAIRESVKQTSTGDSEEDERIEAAVRASVLEMRKAAEQQQQQQPQYTAVEQFPVDVKKQRVDDGDSDEDLRNITDEEYQALIEEAVRQSLLEHQQRQVFGQDLGGGHEEGVYRGYVDEKEALKRKEVGSGIGEKGGKRSSLPAYKLHGDSALPAYSPIAPGPPPTLPPRTPSQQTYGEHDEDEEQLRRAIEESEREHRSRSETMQRQQTEEEIVLNYVMKQSLAEEEYRKMHKGKGNQVEDDEDEELKRAMEMSLKSGNTRGGGFEDGGPSGS